MSTRRRDILELYNCFFITTTFTDWIRLLIKEEYYMIIINSIMFCQKKYEADLIAYVLMPNHIHLILFYNNKIDVSGFLRDMKKYTSVKIRQLLEQEGEEKILNEMVYKKYGQKYKIWKDRFDALMIRHKSVLLTKIKYIHNNPVKSGLVERAEEWRYSSANYYVTEEEGILPIKHAWKII
jgi:putative transposase